MADLALVNEDGSLERGQEAAKTVRENIQAAREHRKQFEGVWQQSLAFAAGEQWNVWDTHLRTLRKIGDVDPRYRGRELYTADHINEYRMIALGELGSDDDRPELLLQHDDKVSEDYQAQANRALGFGWEFEWRGDEILAEADRLCVDLGTSAIRCRFDSTAGKVAQAGEVPLDNIPHADGRPILNSEEAVRQVAAAAEQGRTLSYGPVHDGAIRWEALSAFNLLVPPGVVHERLFPWECVVRPVLLSTIKEEFGAAARDLREDGDISSTLGLSSSGGSDLAVLGESREGRLKAHGWLFTYYHRPDAQHPKGRTFHLAGNDLQLLRVDERLPYQAPDEGYRSGISYFHWWRVTGRFWSRSLVEALKESQRRSNKRATQTNEIIDRSLPYVLAPEGTEADREGLALELVFYKRGEIGAIQVVQGIGPGSWMRDDREQTQDDADRASGIRAPTRGENPPNVTTYAALARLGEADSTKRQPVMRERQRSIGYLVEDSVYDIRTYWGEAKQMLLRGEDEQVEAVVFNATKIPPFFIVKPAKGTAKPRSQAAELKKVEDLWVAALQSQAVVRRPDTWIHWLKESLDAGQALDLPEDPGDEHADKAELENHLLLTGVPVAVAYYDPPLVHVPIHRSAQIEAEMAGEYETATRIDQHIVEHLEAGQANAAQLATTATPTLPAPPNANVSPNPSA